MALLPGSARMHNNLCVVAMTAAQLVEGGDGVTRGLPERDVPGAFVEATKACKTAVKLYKAERKERQAAGRGTTKLEKKLRGAEANAVRARKARRAYKPRQPFDMEIPRVTKAELDRNATLQSGHWPYIVTDAMEAWPAMSKWQDLEYLRSIVPETEWVDFYANNMYDRGSKPILYKFKEALERWAYPMKQDQGKPRYVYGQ